MIAAIIVALLERGPLPSDQLPDLCRLLVSVEAEMTKVSWPTRRTLREHEGRDYLHVHFTVLIYLYDVIFRLF